MAQNAVVIRLGVGDSRNGLLWDDQHVDRGGGLDIADSQDQIVFVDDLRGNLARGNFLEQSFTHSKGSIRYQTTSEQSE
jgi:hypothetical protein